MLSKYCYSPQIYLRPSFKGISSQIDNFQKVDETLYRGGKPTAEQLQNLKNQGVDTIINFKTGFHGNGNVEEQIVRNLGMNYIHLPFISWENPPKEYVDKFFEIMDNARVNNKKVFIHCAHGKDRTGLFSAMYKLKYGVDNVNGCIKELIQLGHDPIENPNIIPYLQEYAKTLN